PGWAASEVFVEPNCNNTDFVDTGLYADYEANYPDAKGPVFVVSARNVEYPWMFGLLGAIMTGIRGSGSNQSIVLLSASSNSPAIGL
ncbi:MAG: hypothetical protein ACK4NZ_15135, partial [Tsuneonella sp.]